VTFEQSEVFIVRGQGFFRVLSLVCLAGWVPRAFGAQAEPGEIRLVVRGDDIASCHAANVACIQSYREGIVRSVEIMVCCPWFNEAVAMLRENPGLDVGVHLDLTAEWDLYKWGPLTKAPSLVDRDGYFFPTVRQRKDFPPNTGFVEAKPDLAEVEKELRAQIERAKARIPNVSHLSSHMGIVEATPELRALASRLSQEYKLPFGPPGIRNVRGFGGATPEEREAALVKVLEDLQPGLWLLVEHPGLDTPEMQAIGHLGSGNVAASRNAVTKAFTSERVKGVAKKRAIRLLSYADALKN
jgi:hypothetical protein